MITRRIVCLAAALAFAFALLLTSAPAAALAFAFALLLTSAPAAHASEYWDGSAYENDRSGSD